MHKHKNRKGFVNLLRVLVNRVAVCTVLGFLALIGIIYYGGRELSVRNAEKRLYAAAEDIVGELDDCVGRQLAYVGKTICKKYKSPEKMSGLDSKAIEDLKGTYDLDEVNAIDGNGIIVASNLPIVGDDQWEKENPRKFNIALLKERRGKFAQCFRESADEPGQWYKYVGVEFPPPAKGYLQIGFKRYRMEESFDYTMRELANAWHIGEHGFYVVSKTSNNEILSTLDESLSGKMLGDVGFDIFTARNESNVEMRDPLSQDFLGFREVKYFDSYFNGEKCRCTSGVVNQFHRYVAAIPYSEIYAPVWRGITYLGILLFLALVLVDMFMLRLSRQNAELDLKNLKLKTFIEKDRERRLQDLTLAKTIQVSSLPVVFPDEPDFRIFARMDTAREVGGDFYDFYELPNGDVVFIIGDVCGKGVPAALFMMRAKAMLHSAVFEHPGDIAAAVAEANSELAEKNDAEMFVTAWIGVYNRKTREVRFVNAGHNPPLVKRADGSVEWLKTRGGPALAAMGGMSYRTGSVKLVPGDSLFLYTDGVTEAMNAAESQYGEERLERALKGNADGFIVNAIRADVTLFVAGAEPSDDITMLALDLKPE